MTIKIKMAYTSIFRSGFQKILCQSFVELYCIHTKKLSCLKSGVEFDMNDILYEFNNLHHC